MIGKFVDIINNSNLIPIANNLWMGIIMMIIGMFVMGYGCYLYIGCELGCGPRDGVMVGLSSKLNKPIKIVRGSIEVFVLIIGIFLGGKFGIGTLISAFAIGYCIQIVFKLRNFDAVSLNHKSILDTIKL